MTTSRLFQAAGAALLLAATVSACSSSGSGGGGTTSPAATSPAATSPAATSPAAASPAATSPAGTASPSGANSNAAVRVSIKNFLFEPADITVRPGATVTVVNEDSTAHTLTASDKSFDTGTIAPGGTATFIAPAQAGSHPYICSIHPFMHGTLTVS
ncbi:cupredoxin domain-containing protein [Streptomyces sp. CB01881]|uniref:cupredoxin domain-containing protein n=1 Tax=Streptomyces sp. CB01881 TaxID=2078691 RepID=UPI000CDCC893|nr:cupredoxin domain-containing protein [Streptomyces sp. CB01881]AUY47652.1 metal-binding protein [Streptomyces sp. CB01881]TYC76125.1 metal-binding protein [Streptomyces sp. CB01881]